jgi:hypothetical protein
MAIQQAATIVGVIKQHPFINLPDFHLKVLAPI